jgi:hypothetical protein
VNPTTESMIRSVDAAYPAIEEILLVTAGR